MECKEAKYKMVCPLRAMLFAQIKQRSITISKQQLVTHCALKSNPNTMMSKQHFDQEFLYYGYFPLKKKGRHNIKLTKKQKNAQNSV